MQGFKILAFSALLFFSFSAQADRVWMFKNVIIKDVAVYNKNSGSGTSYQLVQVKFESPTPVNTGCTPTDAHSIVGHYSTGSINSNVQARLSVLLSAQAQGIPVDLLVDENVCNEYQGWNAFGSPAGLGKIFYGVKASQL
ncbi:hypothetical protein [Alcanivorax sp.]|jgi:hypothetical protein|uniref:hypothetical protein n=1 Tax=Alcanivorax sp. TaxID=1872427 RepID=UPI0025BD2701|nr:hypothetical protein [Alcanivorax sp.]